MKRIRVLIVEDSAVVREHLRRVISKDPRLEVAGMAASGEEAIPMVDQLAPDVITMDIQLPGLQGFEVTRRIMARRPTPIVVVSGIGMEESTLSMQALKAGALAVVEKPVASTHQDYESIASKLCTQLAIMSEVHVVRQRPPTPSPKQVPLTAGAASRSGSYRILGVAASTGGPSALLQLFTGLGRQFPLPIVLVQHMTPGFVNGFAKWLSGAAPFPVVVVDKTTPLRPGHVFMAPSDRHIVVQSGAVTLDDGPAIGNHRPSANILFSSMAASVGNEGIGVLLTGMGEDGALGLRELRISGAFTIAESEATAVVYGMPAAAVKLNAASESLPIGEIGPRILELAGSPKEDS